MEGIFPWNGYFYATRKGKNGNPDRYFKAKSVRFDDTFGGTEEITLDEYTEAAKKYHDVMDW